MPDKILQWNINGLHAHLAYLQKLTADEKPDIICIQETNFKNLSFHHIKNFEIHHQNRANCLSASGGVATYINKNIYCEEIKLSTSLEAVASSVILP